MSTITHGQEAKAGLEGQSHGWTAGTRGGKHHRSPAQNRETHKDCASESFYGGDQKHMGEGERFNALMEKEMLPLIYEGSELLPQSESFLTMEDNFC